MYKYVNQSESDWTYAVEDGELIVSPGGEAYCMPENTAFKEALDGTSQMVFIEEVAQ